MKNKTVNEILNKNPEKSMKMILNELVLIYLSKYLAFGQFLTHLFLFTCYFKYYLVKKVVFSD